MKIGDIFSRLFHLHRSSESTPLSKLSPEERETLVQMSSVDGLFLFEENKGKLGKRLKKPEDIALAFQSKKRVLVEYGAEREDVSSIYELDKLAEKWGLKNEELNLIVPSVFNELLSPDGVSSASDRAHETYNLALPLRNEKAIEGEKEKDPPLSISDDTINEYLREKGVSLKDRFISQLSLDEKVKLIMDLELKDIKAILPKLKEMSDDQLREEALKLRKAVREGKLNLLTAMPKAYALVAEASHRVLGYYPYDVQFKGAIAMALGTVIEMKTGEGKTLTSTMPIFLHALLGKGVHVVTANDYLVKRDATTMGKIYKFLGLSVGYITPDMPPEERKKAYEKDITYGTLSEFAFDYLRDSLAQKSNEILQRSRSVLLIDEADFVMIDDALTPLIISAPIPDDVPPEEYKRIDKLVKSLKPDEDFKVDMKLRRAYLTERGISKLEGALGVDNLYKAENRKLLALIDNALQANYVLKKDVDYIIKNGKVLLVNQGTGRIMNGRTYSLGLQQAVEVKEGLEPTPPSESIARISVSNYIKLYKKVMGMTGTAKSSEDIFREVYNLPVVQIPTRKPVKRIDHPDLIFRTKEEKYEAVLKLTKKLISQNRAVLIGTQSIEESERLSQLFKKHGIPHQVLNAKHHEKEAEIIAQAGKPGRVTIATNMAGRGVDIKLEPEVRKAGGLFVIGTEHSPSKRVDDQLRGRAGRQGDPGDSIFIVSLEDELIKRYIGEVNLKVDVPKGTALNSQYLRELFARAQRKAEGEIQDTLRRLKDFDKEVGKAREVYMAIRDKLMRSSSPKELEEISYLLLQQLWEAFSEDQRAEVILEVIPDISRNSERLEKEDVQEFIRSKLSSLRRKPEKLELLKEGLMEILSKRWVGYLESQEELRLKASYRALAGERPEDAYAKMTFRAFQRTLGLSLRDFLWLLNFT